MNLSKDWPNFLARIGLFFVQASAWFSLQRTDPIFTPRIDSIFTARIVLIYMQELTQFYCTIGLIFCAKLITAWIGLILVQASAQLSLHELNQFSLQELAWFLCKKKLTQFFPRIDPIFLLLELTWFLCPIFSPRIDPIFTTKIGLIIVTKIDPIFSV